MKTRVYLLPEKKYHSRQLVTAFVLLCFREKLALYEVSLIDSDPIEPCYSLMYQGCSGNARSLLGHIFLIPSA
jgi:hypothetical protein